MSTDDPPKEKAPPDPGNRNTVDETAPNRSIKSSAAKLMAVAQEALDVAKEHRADLEPAPGWH